MSGPLDVVRCTGGVVTYKVFDAAIDSAMMVASDPGITTDVALSDDEAKKKALEVLRYLLERLKDSSNVALSGVKEGTEEVAKKEGLEALGYLLEPLKDSPMSAAGALTVVSEGIPFVMDSSKAIYRLWNGAISGKDCAVLVTRGGTKAVCCAGGSWLGAGIGQALIPVPFLGAVVGGTVGNLLGRCTARGIPFL